jgi:hypothetical protein
MSIAKLSSRPKGFAGARNDPMIDLNLFRTCTTDVDLGGILRRAQDGPWAGGGLGTAFGCGKACIRTRVICSEVSQWLLVPRLR